VGTTSKETTSMRDTSYDTDCSMNHPVSNKHTSIHSTSLETPVFYASLDFADRPFTSSTLLARNHYWDSIGLYTKVMGVAVVTIERAVISF